MSRLIWTPQALTDIQRYRFLANKDLTSARNAISEIRCGVKILSLQPALGRPIDEMKPEFREWPVSFGNSGYVVLYRIEIDIVAMLAVRHQKKIGWSTERSVSQ